MITTGQTLQNPATGETLVFRTTSADTNGDQWRPRSHGRVRPARGTRVRDRGEIHFPP